MCDAGLKNSFYIVPFVAQTATVFHPIITCFVWFESIFNNLYTHQDWKPHIIHKTLCHLHLFSVCQLPSFFHKNTARLQQNTAHVSPPSQSALTPFLAHLPSLLCAVVWMRWWAGGGGGGGGEKSDRRICFQFPPLTSVLLLSWPPPALPSLHFSPLYVSPLSMSTKLPIRLSICLSAGLPACGVAAS